VIKRYLNPLRNSSSAMASKKGIFVVAGVGNATGTGGATARLFSKAGYRVALIARNADHLKNVAEEIKQAGGDAAAFPVNEYNHASIHSAFDAIKAHWPKEEIRVTLYNAAHGVWKPFLDVTEEDVKASADVNIIGAFAFAKESILAFKDLELDEVGKRGALFFTSATAALRGNKTTSAFAAGKFALRALSQSLAKEFGKQNIHVSTAIIDGGIITDRSRGYRNDPKWEVNEDVRLNPESIAKSYLYLANQDRSAWTWELDLRPAHEHW